MSDIKFRFWNIKLRRMVYTAGIGCIYEYLRDEYKQFDWRDIITLQYIGLKDKNGKEGYDSDFFKDKNGVIYLVDHDEDGWIFKNGDVGYRPSTFRTSIPYSLDGEFIGNIYENPELLDK